MDSHDQNGAIHLPVPAPEVVAVMVPFLAHGHLNQLLHLSHRISAYNIPIHFVSTTTHIHQLRSRHHNSGHRSTPSAAPIHFHEFPNPPITSDHSIPPHRQPLFDSTLHLRRPVADLVLSLSATAGKVAVVHDVFMSYVVQDVHDIPNTETYIFTPLSAFATFWIEWERLGRPFPVDSPEIAGAPVTVGRGRNRRRLRPVTVGVGVGIAAGYGRLRSGSGSESPGRWWDCREEDFWEMNSR